MTPEEQRIAIDKVRGWKFRPSEKRPEQTLCRHQNDPPDGWRSTDIVSDYLNDLNAMHDVEALIPDEKWGLYEDRLEDLTREGLSAWGWCRGAVHATAAQRAEAFLRVLNLWTE